MEPELFADTIGTLTVQNGVVKFDLMVLEPDPNADPGQGADRGRPVFRRRVVMPIDGFLRAFGAMETIVKQMADRGMISKSGGADAPEAADTKPAKAKGKGSPNFQE